MAKRNTKQQNKNPPVIQAGASPFNGVVPPPEHRFKPGESGNPAGRPPAGLVMKEWLNQMCGWGLDQLQSVMRDISAPVAKKAAARVWLDAASEERNSAGSPIAGGEFDRIADRTVGKPTQEVIQRVDGTFRNISDAEAATDEVLARLASICSQLGLDTESPA